MVRLRVREVAEQEPRVNRTKLGRVADVSATTMDKIWSRPQDISVRLDTLVRIADALTALKGRNVTVLDLIEAESGEGWAETSSTDKQ